MGHGETSFVRASGTLRTLLFLVSFVVVIISAQTWWEVEQDRQLTIESEKNSSLIAVRSLAEHDENILLDVDLMLASTAMAIQTAESNILKNNVALHQILAHEKRASTPIESLRYVDQNGISTASSEKAFINDSEPLHWHRSNADKASEVPYYFVGHITKSLNSDQLVLPLMREFFVDGQYAGLLVAELRVSHFSNFHQRITNNKAIVSLRTIDGMLLIRSPRLTDGRDIDLRLAASTKRIRKGPDENTFIEHSKVTGENMLFAYKKIHDAEMVSIYARRMNDVLAPWKSRTINRIFLSIGVCGFILLALAAFLIYYRYKKKRDDVLSESEQRYRKLYEEGSDAIVLLSEDMRYLDCNAAAEKFFGISHKSRIIGKRVGLFSPQSSLHLQDPDIVALINKAIAGIPQQFEWITVKRQEIIYIDVTLNRTELDKGFAMFAIMRDISARKRAEILQRAQNRILHLVMTDENLKNILKEIVLLSDTQIPDSISSVLLLSEDGTQFNNIFSTHLPETMRQHGDGMPIRHGHGASCEAILTRKPYIVNDLFNDPAMEHVRSLLARESFSSCAAWPIFGKEGQMLGAFSLLFRGPSRVNEQCQQLANVAIDLASIAIESRKAEERIRYLAHYDELTGLPNRFLCTQLINNALAHAEHRGRQVAVCLLDLDRFKNINDTFGHETGELLLQEIAIRFRACLREMDILARVGGDEFIAMIDDYEDPLQLGEIAQLLLSEARKPFDINGQQYQLSTSIGIATYPGDGNNAQTLIKNADIAMYRAKNKGKDDYRFYSQEVNTHTIERIALENELRRAIERDEFVVHYQPKVNLKTSAIVGAEALVRWQHPVRGLLPPCEFVSLAEEAGLIDQIGLQVLDHACADIRVFNQLGLSFGRIAINLAASQFDDDNLLADIQRVVQVRGVSATNLEFEITESMVMNNREEATAIMDGIRALGFTLAIDDFGTGYSSLAYLTRFPVDNIKIDKSFIDDVPDDSNSNAIVQAIIAMAHALNLKVVTEGVETDVQLKALQVFGSDEYQGYLFSRPVACAQFIDILQRQQEQLLTKQTTLADGLLPTP